MPHPLSLRERVRVRDKALLSKSEGLNDPHPALSRRERVLSMPCANSSRLDDHTRFAIRLAQHRQKIGEGEGDAALGGREIVACDMEEDGAAGAGDHRRIVVAER